MTLSPAGIHTLFSYILRGSADSPESMYLKSYLKMLYVHRDVHLASTSRPSDTCTLLVSSKGNVSVLFTCKSLYAVGAIDVVEAYRFIARLEIPS